MIFSGEKTSISVHEAVRGFSTSATGLDGQAIELAGSLHHATEPGDRRRPDARPAREWGPRRGPRRAALAVDARDMTDSGRDSTLRSTTFVRASAPAADMQAFSGSRYTRCVVLSCPQMCSVRDMLWDLLLAGPRSALDAAAHVYAATRPASVCGSGIGRPVSRR